MTSSSPARASELTTAGIARLRYHIHQMWEKLTRSPRHIKAALADPKWNSVEGWPPLYIGSRETPERIRHRLTKSLGQDMLSRIDLRVLPAEASEIKDHGLLYLPGRYVVPGGRFNELYAWDSYFIVLGLLREGRAGLASSMADQMLYCVQHYGTVPTANRTYYLTRSQPPLLGRIVLAVYESSGDLDWLANAAPLVEKYCYYWTVPPHHVASTGLSRYHGLGHGPCAEVLSSERDEDGRTHYDRLAAELLRHRDDAGIERYLDLESGTLTAEAYLGDRALRESGFDITGRFGIGGVEAAHHVPVCLNTLLWRMERDMARIFDTLDQPEATKAWQKRAAERAVAIQETLWDENEGIFLDYHTLKLSRTRYPFATAFWPMWAGLARPDQAQRMVEKWLPLFEAPGGLVASLQPTGCQWDYPMAWAPLVLLAVEGLERYGYVEPARRIARRYLAMLHAEFQRTGHLFEKYDAVAVSSEVEHHIRFGYSENQRGFGWTNACALELLYNLGALGHSVPHSFGDTDWDAGTLNSS
jgi:alpha,alpha-trehalase